MEGHLDLTPWSGAKSGAPSGHEGAARSRSSREAAAVVQHEANVTTEGGARLYHLSASSFLCGREEDGGHNPGFARKGPG